MPSIYVEHKEEVMAQVVILVGSVYGNANSVADECAEYLNNTGHQAEVLTSPVLEDILTRPQAVILLCTSTTGDGEIPDGLYPLYDEMQSKHPFLTDRRYGLISLGDSSYELFANAGKEFDALMHMLQAKRLGQPFFIDACETADPESAALDWLKGWVAEL